MGVQRYRVPNFKFANLKTRWVVHPLQQGDSLYRLAEEYETSVLQIIRDNPPLDPRRLVIGQVLLIRTEKEPATGRAIL